MSWIKCSEKEPPLLQIVHVVLKGEVVLAEYMGEHGFMYLCPVNRFQDVLTKSTLYEGTFIKPTHWMPLPEAPNELD